MEDTQKPMTKIRTPSKLDSHLPISLSDFEGKMGEVLTVMPKEIQRHEARCQRKQTENRKNKQLA